MYILDIFIYLSFAIIMFMFANNSNMIYGKKIYIDKYLWYFILFFAVIAGIRWNVGVDSVSYAMDFKIGDFLNSHDELIWHFLLDLISSNGIHWSIGLGIVAMLQMFFIINSIKEFKFIILFLPFVLFGGRYWADLMNGIRQMLVVCMFVWASRLIYRRQFLKYLLFVIISIQIHASSIILLPMYFIPNNIRIYNKRKMLILILLICFVIGSTPSFQSFAEYFQTFATYIGYEGYSEMVGEFLQGYTEESLSFGPIMLTFLLIPIYIIWFGPELIRKYEMKIPYLVNWYNYSFLYACLFFLFCNISHLLLRPIAYFVLFQMLLASLLLYYLFRNKHKNIPSYFSYLTFCLIIFTSTAWNVYKAQSNNQILNGIKWESTTYKVFFMHEDEVRKFNL